MAEKGKSKCLKGEHAGDAREREEKERKRTTRREFVKGTAVGAAGVAAAGVLAGCAPAATPSPQVIKETVEVPVEVTREVVKEVEAQPWLPEKWDKEADVVVVGSGAAGLVAAIEAHDAGAEVLILEALPMAGGSMRLSGGIVYGCDTSLQKAMGVTDSPDEMVKYNMAIGAGMADPEHARVWAENCGKLVDWLKDLGVKFGDPTISGEEDLYAEVAKPAPRGHPAMGQGAGIAEVLITEVEDRGIEMLFETRALQLIAKNPYVKTEILGLKAESGGKTLYVKARKAVMLAAGGYCTNPDFLKKFCIESMPAEPNPMMLFDNGDGILMAHALGADFFAIDNLGLRTFILRGWPEGFAGYTRLPPTGDFIYVNLEGRRFVDESTFYGKIPDILATQTGARCYMIFDDDAAKTGGENIGWDFSHDLSKEIEAGAIKKADKIEGLANLLGLDPVTLEATINTWNEHAKEGTDPDFNRETVAPIDTPPFYAGFINNYAGYNYGGVRINTESQVIDVFGNVISRLYAAGSTTGGCLGKIHLGGGTLLSKSMTFGRIAGRNAAAETPWG